MSSTTNTSLPAIWVRDFQSLMSQRGDLCSHVPVLILLCLAGPGRENFELHGSPLDCVHSLPLGWKACVSSPKLGPLNSGGPPSYLHMRGLLAGRFHHRGKAQVC